MKNILIFVVLIININVFATKNISLIGKGGAILTSFGVNYKHPVRPVNYFSAMEYYKNLLFKNIKYEVWKDIPNYEGFYQASNLGRIKRLSRFVLCKGNKTKKNKALIRKQKKSIYGYLYVTLFKHGTVTDFRSHRLIALTFLKNTNSKPFVNHINGIKTDNRIENLEWCTGSENELHSYRFLGKESPMKGKTGKLNHSSIPIYQLNLNGEIIREWDSCTSVKKELGYNVSCIRNVCIHKESKHTAYGFKWIYKKEYEQMKQQ